MDKWLTLGIAIDEAQKLRLIEDACRDNDDFGFFTRVHEELQKGITPQEIMRRYEVRDANLPG